MKHKSSSLAWCYKFAKKRSKRYADILIIKCKWEGFQGLFQYRKAIMFVRHALSDISMISYQAYMQSILNFVDQRTDDT